MRELILLLQADQDIQSAFNRYEDFQSGRGELFMLQVDACLTLLRSHPEIAPIYSKPYCRALVRGFPYGVFTRSNQLGLSLRPLSICDKDPRRSDVNCLVKRPRIDTGGVPLCYTKRVLKTKVDDHN